MRALAIDFGGSHISCGALDDEQLLGRVVMDADSTQPLGRYLPLVARTLREMMERFGGEFAGVACGFCGLVDFSAARVIDTNEKYPDASELDFPGWSQKELGLPLALENDARLALLGEHYRGAARHSEDVVMISFGTGIGTSALMNGKLLRGRHFRAGCLGGHFTVDLAGLPCSCGAHGCFEAEASTYALPAVAKSWRGFAESALARQSKLDFQTLFQCAGEGDRVAGEIRDRCLRVWSACAFSLIHAYDPELVVLGGGVMKSSYPILETIQRHVDVSSWSPLGQVRFKAAELGSESALYGAIPLLQSLNAT